MVWHLLCWILAAVPDTSVKIIARQDRQTLVLCRYGKSSLYGRYIVCSNIRGKL